MTTHLDTLLDKMTAEDLPPVVRETFADYYTRIYNGETGMIRDAQISPLTENDVPGYAGLASHEAVGREAMGRTVRIILNGGLGTSMGLTGPKSLLPVRRGKSFLYLLLTETRRRSAALALMNSFSTHTETTAEIARMGVEDKPLCFLQHKFPKLLADGFGPVHWPEAPHLEWNPPGHGDIYTALHTSGMLERMLNSGVEYAFISNCDNLGATLDDRLLGYFVNGGFPFMMETALRTPSDMKGGHLARCRDGRILLREAAQCPKSEIAAFQDIERYRYFNTNNLWIRLRSLKELIDRKRTVRLPIIVNPKKLDPRNPASPDVIQVETAMGAAISLFEGAAVVAVPRDRFFPVKKCHDLLAVRSDYFLLTKDDRLVLNPERKYDDLRVTLDSSCYSLLEDFEARFPEGAPSLKACRSLSVTGDLVFGAGVKVIDDADVRNLSGVRRRIPDGTVLTGRVDF